LAEEKRLNKELDAARFAAIAANRPGGTRTARHGGANHGKRRTAVVGSRRRLRHRRAPPPLQLRDAMRIMIIVVACLALPGCGLAAAPSRVTSAGLDIVPLAGHVAATPTDACADAIDPG
jgi:hypothetical protein